MGEQYYYLLDEKEQGPFSRAAMEGLLKTGRLKDVFIRSGTDQPWQTPEEMGFAAGASPVAPAVAPSPVPNNAAPDPASVVFRSKREIAAAKSPGIGSSIAGAVLVLGLLGGGAWYLNEDRSAQAPEEGNSDAGTTSWKSDRISLEALQTGTWTSDKYGGVVIKNGEMLIEQPEKLSNGYQEIYRYPTKSGTHTTDDGYMTLNQAVWRGDKCLKNDLILIIPGSPAIGIPDEFHDRAIGVCIASHDTAMEGGGPEEYGKGVAAAGEMYLIRTIDTNVFTYRLQLTKN